MSFASIPLKKWSDIHQHDRRDWIYRGQSSAQWPLATTYERCCEQLKVPSAERRSLEDRLCREFRRAYHQYAAHVPPKSAVLEWLSLMQHHGAPTRLLDFTYSIYVAGYFALEEAQDDCAVWAIHGPWALQASCARFAAAGRRPEAIAALQQPYDEKDDDAFNEMFLAEPPVLCASPQNPFRLNERLRIQKGVFVVPGSVVAAFKDNLRALDGHEDPQHVVR